MSDGHTHTRTDTHKKGVRDSGSAKARPGVKTRSGCAPCIKRCRLVGWKVRDMIDCVVSKALSVVIIIIVVTLSVTRE